MQRPRIHAFLAGARQAGFLGVVLAAALFAVSGCGMTRSPLALDESLQPQDVEEILVLPVIDARPSRLDHIKVARNVGDAATRMLRERGYFVLETDRFRERPSIPLDLGEADAASLGRLAPEDSTYFLVVQVQRLDRGVDETGETWDAQLAAVLVDRERGRVVWRDVATASSSLSGALTVFARGSRQYEAAINATRALVDTLPKRTAGTNS